MSLRRIILFCLDAGAFALPGSLLFLFCHSLWSRSRGGLNWSREGKLWLFASYLLALLKITAIRQAGLGDLSLCRGLESVQLLPLILTLEELKNGLWAFVYPVAGNLLWFLPLGFFLRWLWEKSWKSCLLWSGALSLFIEVCQWLLGSGISDIDDVILNILGGLLGWWLLPYILNFVKKERRT